MTYLLLILFTFFNSTVPVEDVSLSIEISEMRSTQGDIIVAVFVDQEGFKAEEPFVRKVYAKSENVAEGIFKCEFDLPAGNYGVSILDDENADGEMEYNFVGIPKEGYGFSDFYHTGFSRPVFSDFDFLHDGDTEVKQIKLRYF